MITDQKELVFLSQLNIIQIDIRKKNKNITNQTTAQCLKQ